MKKAPLSPLLMLPLPRFSPAFSIGLIALLLSASRAAADPSDPPVISPFTRVAVMGDSITGQTGDGYVYYRSGLWTALSSRLSQQLDLVWNGSVPAFSSSGKDSLFIEATDLPLVLQSNAEACILMAGTNDYYQSREPADVAAILARMCHTLEDHGVTPILCDVLPIASGIPAKSAWLVALKAQVDTVCAADPRILHIDWFRVLDPDGDGVADSSYFADGLHPTANGMTRLGAYATTLLQPYVRPRDFLAGITWLTGNPTLEAGSSFTPSQWSYDATGTSSTVTTSLIPRPGGGNWWQITTANAASPATSIQLYGPSVTLTGSASPDGTPPAWTAGDAVEVVAEFETDPGTSPAWNLSPRVTAYPSYHVTADSVPGGGATDMLRVPAGILRSPPLILPAGTTATGCSIQLTGTGTFRLGRTGLRKLSPSFATWILASSVTDKSPAGDPDGDGLSNQIEWLLGGDPAISDAATLTALQQPPSENSPTFSFHVAPRSAGDSRLTLQRSADLTTWSDFTPGVDTSPDVTQDPADPTLWQVHTPTTPTAFFRLQAAWKK